jgi:hypothetical protein
MIDAGTINEAGKAVLTWSEILLILLSAFGVTKWGQSKKAEALKTNIETVHTVAEKVVAATEQQATPRDNGCSKKNAAYDTMKQLLPKATDMQIDTAIEAAVNQRKAKPCKPRDEQRTKK